MPTCPNCGKELDPKGPLCGCSVVFNGAVTNVQGWETETIYRPSGPPAAGKRSRRNAAVGITLAILLVGAAIALAWPRYLTSPRSFAISDETETAAAVSEPEGVRSGLVPADDLIPTSDPVSEQGEVFVFSPGAQTSTPVNQRIPSPGVTAAAAAVFPPTSINDAEDASNAHLLSDQASLAADKKTEPSEGELPCKPDTKVALTAPETGPPTPPTSTPAKADSAGIYNLGPRGGCYFVTPSGGKKYVDRSLCSRSNAAAARQ